MQAERFRVLVMPHLDAAYSLARYITRDPIGAEDVVQNAFLRAFKAFPGFQGQAAKFWLLAIVRNCCFDWIRANRLNTTNDITDDDLFDQDTPETILAAKQETEAVRTTLENLPEPFRETLVLREFQDMSYKDIAKMTQVPVGTVMSRLARGRDMLARVLLPAGKAST